MEHKLSVIMLTYNRIEMMPTMVECILAQTFTDYEFIIVDNGSDDGSDKLVDEFAGKDDRIKVIHIEKSSVGKGRNVGLKAAMGEYIAFVDDDDVCEPDFLMTLYGWAKEYDSDVTICGAKNKAYDVSQLMSNVEALEVLFDRKKFNVAFPTKLIKKELFEDDLFDERLKADDIYLMPRMIAKAKRIFYCGKPLYEFVRHDNNLSAWTGGNFKLLKRPDLMEYLKVYEERTKWLNEKFPEERTKWDYFNQSFQISMIDKISRFELEDLYDIRENLKDRMIRVKKEFLDNPKTLDFEKEFVRVYLEG